MNTASQAKGSRRRYLIIVGLMILILILLFDQRGMGMSAPALECAVAPVIQDKERKAELLAKYVARTGVEPDEENQGTVDCVLGLWNQGVELSHYTSAASAADTVDLMRTLGYQGYSLYDISYGTRLAETIARDYPDLDLIRTITLDSVFPRPVGEFDAAYYVGKHEMFEYLFQACAADEAKPILDQLADMTTEHVNEEVKRVFYTPVRSSSGWVRTQFNCNEAMPFGEPAETIESEMRDAAMPQFLIDEALETVNPAGAPDSSCMEGMKIKWVMPDS